MRRNRGRSYTIDSEKMEDFNKKCDKALKNEYYNNNSSSNNENIKEVDEDEYQQDNNNKNFEIIIIITLRDWKII